MKKALRKRLLSICDVGSLDNGETLVVTVFVVDTVRVVSGGAYVLTEADFDVVVCRHLSLKDELLVDLSVDIEVQNRFAIVRCYDVQRIACANRSQATASNIHLVTADTRPDI